MEDIIAPVPTKLIEEELSKDVFLRTTNKGGNEIYIVSAKNAPNTLREIGRLREVSFRAAGGGAGVSCDIDKYDTMERPYHQLIVWNPEEKEIIGGYRYLHGCEATFQPNGQPNLTSSHLFIYSDKFIKDYLPYTIELGRSFVRPEYQSSKKGAKSLYALDNLWDGLGALTLTIPNTKYFFGKARCKRAAKTDRQKYARKPLKIKGLRALVSQASSFPLDLTALISREKPH